MKYEIGVWFLDKFRDDVVDLLVGELNADPNIKDSWGRTPLHFFAYCQDERNFNYLVSKGGNPKALDNKGRPALKIKSRRNAQ